MQPPAGVSLKPLAKVTGHGPSPEVIDLARWAAWRWAGRPAQLLATASPPATVRTLPAVAGTGAAPAASLADPAGPPVPSPALPDWAAAALEAERAVLRLGPLADRYPVVAAAVADAQQRNGQALILCPTVAEALQLGGRLRRAGVPTAVVAEDGPPSAVAGEWARAAGGATAVVGARAAAWAPAPLLCRAVLLDEHDESYQQEQAPTWHARDVLSERCSRAGARCLLVSPCPTLEALDWGRLVTPDRLSEKAQWPRIEIIDRREEEPGRAGLYSPRLVDLLRSGGRVVCVLNRVGRAKLLSCTACGELTRCEVCGASVELTETGSLRCRRCAAERPEVCVNCGSTRFKNLRVGISRAREELEALVGEPVEDVKAGDTGPLTARVVVGTEAVLHRATSADAVVLLDMDQELTAYRYRAVEEALALLARCARLLRVTKGRLVVQTRQPEHQVLAAAVQGDPSPVADSQRPLRAAIRFPPAAALAVVSGPAAAALVDGFGSAEGVEVLGPTDGAWLLRAANHQTLCDALAATRRPPGRLRIEVDPLRI